MRRSRALFGAVALLLGCAARPSSTTLADGGSVLSAEQRADRKARPGAARDEAAAPLATAEGAKAAPETAPANAATAAKPAVRMLAVGETLTRSMRMDFAIAMTVEEAAVDRLNVEAVAHQQVRFKVLRVEGNLPAEVELHYVEERMLFEALGQREEQNTAVHGNRYRADYRRGLKLGSTNGRPLDPEELETVRDDARQFLALQSGLGKLAASLTASGAPTGSVPPELLDALADSEKQTGVTDRGGKFNGFAKLASGEQGARYDVNFDMGFQDQEMTFKSSFSGVATFGTNPWRALTVVASGPASMQGVEPESGMRMEGSGHAQMNVTYTY